MFVFLKCKHLLWPFSRHWNNAQDIYEQMASVIERRVSRSHVAGVCTSFIVSFSLKSFCYENSVLKRFPVHFATCEIPTAPVPRKKKIAPRFDCIRKCTWSKYFAYVTRVNKMFIHFTPVQNKQKFEQKCVCRIIKKKFTQYVATTQTCKWHESPRGDSK